MEVGRDTDDVATAAQLLREEVTRGVPHPASLDRMARLDITTLERVSGAARWETAAAMAYARVRKTSPHDAYAIVAAVNWEVLDRRARLSANARAWGWSIIAHVFLSRGDTRAAVHAAHRSLERRDDEVDPTLLRRSAAIAAAGLAVNGENDASRRLRRRALALPVHSDLDALIPLAAAIVAEREADAWAMRMNAEHITALAPGDSTVDRIAELITASALVIEGRVPEASARARRILHSAQAPQLAPLVTAAARGLLAHSLILRGEHLRALSSLEEVSSPTDHAICFGVIRASALLHAGKTRESLRATDECVRMGSAHSLRTITAVHLHRAAALERLGHSDAADGLFADGIHLVLQSGTVRDLVELPSPEVDALLSRSTVVTEAMMTRLREMRAAIPGAHSVPERTRTIPPFTPRERVMARALLTGASMRRIADDLHVSLNTVKSQTRAIYRKTGVRSRAELISTLEDMGFGSA